MALVFQGQDACDRVKAILIEPCTAASLPLLATGWPAPYLLDAVCRSPGKQPFRALQLGGLRMGWDGREAKAASLQCCCVPEPAVPQVCAGAR